MADYTVHVIRVTEDWPKQIDSDPSFTTIDLTITPDGDYVRMGYTSTEITSAQDVVDSLTADKDIITNHDMKHSEVEFDFPVGGVDKSAYVPDDFVVSV